MRSLLRRRPLCALLILLSYILLHTLTLLWNLSLVVGPEAIELPQHRRRVPNNNNNWGISGRRAEMRGNRGGGSGAAAAAGSGSASFGKGERGEGVKVAVELMAGRANIASASNAAGDDSNTNVALGGEADIRGLENGGLGNNIGATQKEVYENGNELTQNAGLLRGEIMKNRLLQNKLPQGRDLRGGGAQNWDGLSRLDAHWQRRASSQRRIPGTGSQESGIAFNRGMRKSMRNVLPRQNVMPNTEFNESGVKKLGWQRATQKAEWMQKSGEKGAVDRIGVPILPTATERALMLATLEAAKRQPFLAQHSPDDWHELFNESSPVVSIRGEMSTGTGYLRELLKRNCPTVQFKPNASLDLDADSLYGWKHGVIGHREIRRLKSRPLHSIVVMSRNAIPWVVSLFRMSKQLFLPRRQFRFRIQFVLKRYYSFDNGTCPEVEFYSEENDNVMKSGFIVQSGGISHAFQKAALIRHEDLQASTLEVFRELVERLPGGFDKDTGAILPLSEFCHIDRLNHLDKTESEVQKHPFDAVKTEYIKFGGPMKTPAPGLDVCDLFVSEQLYTQFLQALDLDFEKDILGYEYSQDYEEICKKPPEGFWQKIRFHLLGY